MKKIWIARLFFTLGVLAAALALISLWNDNLKTGVALGLFSRRALLVMAGMLLMLLVEAALLGLTWTRWLDRPAAWLAKFLQKCPRWLALIGCLALFAVIPALVLSQKVDATLLGLGVRLWLLVLLALLGAGLWLAFRRAGDWLEALLGMGLAHGVLAVAVTYITPALLVTPFSQGWSEASRFYNASLFLSQSIYGVPLPLPTLHPTRYLLQAAAFLFSGNSILVHRIWQVLLWLACNGFTAWALARRLKLARGQAWLVGIWDEMDRMEQHRLKRERSQMLLLGLWTFLLFFQGPVYYHLVLCAGFVLLGFDRARPWQSLLVVLGASVWAGLSRINWYPVPGVLALVLWLLEEPRGQKPIWRYLLMPAVWVTGGTALAFAANAVYVAISGNPPEVFGSALSSPLLWERLLPNVTYPQGILQASAWAFLPVTVLMALKLVFSGARWNWLRWLGLAGVLGAFFAAGLVVSVKVGGGSNLHNLDNFIVVLAVVAAYAWAGCFTPDRAGEPDRTAWLEVLLAVVLLLPVLQPLADLAPQHKPAQSPAEEQAYLGKLQALLDSAQGKGPVLFISDRQLLTFKNLKAGQFEAEYEKVFLMEMAMSGNPQYLGRFAAELQQHKFPLILTEPLNATMQNPAVNPFAEENNLWVTRVEQPILANYKLLQGFNEGNLWVYAPK